METIYWDLSFSFKNPRFNIWEYEVSIQLFTYENLYGLDPDKVERKSFGNKIIIQSKGLTSSGGQEKIGGTATLIALRQNGKIFFHVEATHPYYPIKSCKIILHGLDVESFTTTEVANNKIPEKGIWLCYPYPDLTSPMIGFTLRNEEKIFIENRDKEVREKRIAIVPKGGKVDVELIFEELATQFDKRIEISPWIISRTNNFITCIENYYDWFASEYGLKSWERREDVPEWARKIKICLCLHGMHWTGYIFNTYKEMEKIIDWATTLIDGEKILVYLPGWEGRYYWQYGDYRPEPRLGGKDGLKRLIQFAHSKGVKIMLMFGSNCTNRHHRDYKKYGPQSRLHEPGGEIFQGNRPDWATERCRDTSWQVWLNPGAPKWRNHLLNQIGSLIKEYNFDAIFLDTSGCWVNDPFYPVFPGYKKIKEKLYTNYPDKLLAGEMWYDALLTIFPLFQGPPLQLAPHIFAKYARSTGHLSIGDISRGSTGVFEKGYNPFSEPKVTTGMIPMLTFVDGTLDKCREELASIIKKIDKQ